MRLTDFSVLTFDCYGTLIDWEAGLHAALQPLLRAGNLSLPRDTVLEAFARHESAQEAATPTMRYPDILAEVHRRLAREWGVPVPAATHAAFGASVPDWPAFPDTAEALRYLKRFFKLVILSNVDRDSFAASNKRLGVEFDAVVTAEDVGSYKPDPRNFQALLHRLAQDGIGPAQVLHTAQSLFHDHRPARAAGLATAWIDRRQGQASSGATMPVEDAGYDFRFPSMRDMAAAHAKQVGAAGR